MRLFSEEVKITSSNSPLNILQVKDFQEVFFGVFEVQINENKYVAEKISEENGNPIVSILVEEGDEKAQYPFLLLKGKQEIYFNSESEPVEIFESNIENDDDEDLEIREIIEETFDNSEIVEDKKQEILEEIKRVKRNAIKKSLEILEHNKARKIQDIKNEGRKKEKALKEYLESARENLVDEFTIISGKIKNELISDNDYKFDEIRESIDLKIQDIADNLNESLRGNFQNSSKLIDKSVKKLVRELYESNINPKVDKELKDIAEEIVEKVSEIDKNLNNKLNEKADVSLIEGVNKELDAIRDANIELNNSLNKGVQKALSRVGNVDKRILEISEKFDNKISETEQEISQYFDEKLSLVKEETLDITDEARKYFQDLIQESRNGLLSEIRKIKNEKPVEYILESKKGKPIVKDWDTIEKDWNKKIHDKFENYKTDLRKYVAVYASGGGTNATQYQDGGTMNGDLTIRGGLISDRIYTTQLDALSANITVIDIKQYELSGFNVTGDVTINGSVSAQNISAANLYSNGVQVATVVDPVRTTLTGNGVLSTFAISGAGSLVNPSALIVAIDGALQEPVVDYTVSSGNITFTSPLANGSKAVVISPVNTIQVGQVTPSDGSVTSAKLDNALTIQNLTSPLASIDSLIINDQATAENQTYSSFDSILTPRVNAGLRGYILNRKCNVGGTWATSHTSGGGSSSRPSHVEMFTNTTLGSKSYIYEPQLNLCELGAATRNGYSTIKWDMSEMWFDWVFNMTYAIFSSNIRTNQIVRFFVGDVSVDGMIGGYAGGIGVRIDSGSSATNYDIRIFHGFGLPYSRAGITAATNASPIVVTQNNHGFQTNDQIEIDGCTGNTATNGIWTVTRINSNTYSLNGSTGNGTLIAGGGSHYISNVLLNTNAFGGKLARILIHKTNGVFNVWLNDTILIGSVTYVASGDPSGAGAGYGFGSLGMMAKTLVASTGSTNMYVYELNYGGKV